MENSILKMNSRVKVISHHYLGILKDPKGVYKGEFLKGEKHGKGTYEY